MSVSYFFAFTRCPKELLVQSINFDQLSLTFPRTLHKEGDVTRIDYMEMLEVAGVGPSRPLDILKIDCENCEHQFFKNIVQANLTEHLPPIIVYELHIGRIPSDDWNIYGMYINS